MADVKISALTPLATIEDADEFVLVDTSAVETKKVAASTVKSTMRSGVILADGTVPMAADLDLGGHGIVDVSGITITTPAIDPAITIYGFGGAVEGLTLHAGGITSPEAIEVGPADAAAGDGQLLRLYGGTAAAGTGGDVTIQAGDGATQGDIEIGTTYADEIRSGSGATQWTHGGDLSVAGTVAPDAGASRDLGETSAAWRRLYLDDAVYTPSTTAIGAVADALTIQVGQSGDGDSTPTAPGPGSELSIRAGKGGAHGGSGLGGGVGGDLVLRSGEGGSASAETAAGAGNVFVGAELGPVGVASAGNSNVVLYVGAQPSPTEAGAILLGARSGIHLRATGSGGEVHVGEDGTGLPLRLYEVTAPPLDVAGSGALYAEAVGGSTELRYMDADGDVVQLGRAAIATDAGTAITMSDADANKVIRCTAGTTVTVTVPAGLKPGTTVEYVQEGAGQVQVVGSSVTLRHGSTFSPYTAEQYSSVVVTILDNDEALVRGDLAVA